MFFLQQKVNMKMLAVGE